MNRNACIVCMTMALVGLGASPGLAGRPKSVPREKVEAVPLASLIDFERAKYYACQAKTAWEMHFHYKKELDTQYDLKNMDGLLQNEHLFENAPELMPYKEKILGSIARIGMIGDHSAFFILDGLTRPIRLINFENKRCICLYIFSSDMIETTSSPNKKVKAANIINDGLFAAMRSFGTGFDLTDISYISIFLYMAPGILQTITMIQPSRRC